MIHSRDDSQGSPLVPRVFGLFCKSLAYAFKQCITTAVAATNKPVAADANKSAALLEHEQAYPWMLG